MERTLNDVRKLLDDNGLSNLKHIYDLGYCYACSIDRENPFSRIFVNKNSDDDVPELAHHEGKMYFEYVEKFPEL